MTPTPDDPRLEVAPVDDEPAGTLVDRSPLDVDDDTLRAGIEAVLFLADEPVETRALVEALGVDATRIEASIAHLVDDYARDPRGIEVRAAAGGWRLYTAAPARAVLERWVLSGRSGRLTQAALETLAVIAYKQPISRQDIGDIRGVNPDAAVRSLVARGFVAEVGRDSGPGQAVLYGTTTVFLERLGLDSLDELPALTEFLADAPAPDEPASDTLKDVRRRLQAGGELATTLAGRSASDTNTGVGDDADADDDDLLPAPQRRDRAGSGDMDDLTGQLERAARSAASRLRSVIASTEVDEEVAPDADTAPGVEDVAETDAATVGPSDG